MGGADAGVADQLHRCRHEPGRRVVVEEVACSGREAPASASRPRRPPRRGAPGRRHRGGRGRRTRAPCRRSRRPPAPTPASARARAAVRSVRSIRQSGSLSQRRRCRNERLSVLRQAFTVAGSPPVWPGGRYWSACGCHHGATSAPMRIPSTTPMHGRSARRSRGGTRRRRRRADRVEAGAHALGRRLRPGRRSRRRSTGRR